MKFLALITALALTMSIGVATASAATQYEGKVVGKSAENRTFRLKDSERGTIRIKVTRNTSFERIAGFGAPARRDEGRRGDREARRRALGGPPRRSAPAAAAATVGTAATTKPSA